MTYVDNIDMDMQALDLVIKYPEMMDKISSDYRIILYKLFVGGLILDFMSKTKEAAILYNVAKDFKLSQPLKIIMEILQVKLSTINRRLHMAREAGLVIKISAEKFGGK